MARDHLFAVFFFAALAFLLYQFYQVFSVFLGPFLWAAVFALVFYPVYGFLLIRLGRPALASLLTTLLVSLLIAAPVATFGNVAVAQGRNFYDLVNEKIASGEARTWLESWRENRVAEIAIRAVPRSIRDSIDLSEIGQQTAQATSQYLLAEAGGIARNVVQFVVDFVLMQVMLFFFFRDGQRLYRGLRDLLPMEGEHKDAIFTQLYETLSAVVQGMTATAAAQGFLAGIGFWALGVPFALLLSLASATASFIPLGGTALVWIPSAGYFFVQGQWGRGIALVMWGTLVISMVDNFVKPMVIGSRTKISTLFLFFGILGGLRAYGLIGAFLGPVLLGTIVTFLGIYREEYSTEDDGGAAAEAGAGDGDDTPPVAESASKERTKHE